MKNPYRYNKGYLMLPVEIEGLAKGLSFAGHSLVLKTSFHVSLLCIKNLPSTQGQAIEKKILNLLDLYLENHSISFSGFTGEIREVKDEKDGRYSLVAMVHVRGLKEFFDLLRKDMFLEVDDQPTHITLYTLGLNKGIGVNNAKTFNALTCEVYGLEIVMIKKILDMQTI